MSANGVVGGGAAFGVDVSTALPMYNMPLTTTVNLAILPIMGHKSAQYHAPPLPVMTDADKWMEVEQAGLLRQSIFTYGASIQQLRSVIATSETEHTGKVSALQERIGELEAQAKHTQETLQLEHASKVLAFEASIAALEAQANAKESSLASEHASNVVGFEKRIADLKIQADVLKDKMQIEKGKHRSYKSQYKEADALCKTLEAKNALLRAAADA